MLTSILSVAVTFVLLVWVHEFGHYWAARAMGVRVEVFSLGMGRRIFGFRRGDTFYQLAWFPLGGFVKLAGAENFDRESPPAPGDFFAQPPGRRAFILVMGSVHNFLLGFIVFVLVFLIGFVTLDYSRPEVGHLQEGFPALAAGLRAGDLVLAVDGEPVSDWDDLSGRIHRSPGRQVTLLVERGADLLTVELVPRLETVEGPSGEVAVGLIGIGPPARLERHSLPSALRRGAGETFRVGGLIFYYLYKLFRGEVSPRELAGPVGIARMTSQFARTGLVNFLFFFALVSVNLGIVNLAFIFLPIVDGWHIVMTGVERLRRRRPSRRFLEISETVGVVLLALLLLLVTYNDLLRLFSR